jgi:hypothetical protein
MGRLPIALLLEHWKVLPHPPLYLSLFIRRPRPRLPPPDVRRWGLGGLAGFLFLDGVATGRGCSLARDPFALVSKDRSKVLEESTASVAAMRLFEMLPANPRAANSVIRLPDTTKHAGKAIETLTSARVLNETTGKQRGREFAYQAYLEKLGS